MFFFDIVEGTLSGHGPVREHAGTNNVQTFHPGVTTRGTGGAPQKKKSAKIKNRGSRASFADRGMGLAAMAPGVETGTGIISVASDLATVCAAEGLVFVCRQQPGYSRLNHQCWPQHRRNSLSVESNMERRTIIRRTSAATVNEG